jgi:methylenetetrahydrofolate reductase (NADPH)
VPAEVLARIDAAEDPYEACFELACEQARHALSLPGVAGLHLISFRKDAGMAKLCERVGIPPRAEREQHGHRPSLTV